MKNILLATLMAAGIYTASAQDIDGTQPFQLGVTDHIESGVAGQSRDLNIYLPKDYTAKKSWPVIYLLDGGKTEDFIHISGIVQFLTDIVDTMPEAIVVGIANVDRKHDFTFAPGSTPEFRKMIPNAGGSKAFISFMEKELMPYIQKKYNATGSQTLIGQSAGGLLATEVVLDHTTMFDNYLIVSPSLWWNDEELLKRKTEQGKVTKPVHVVLAVGNEGDQMMKGSKMLIEYLNTIGNGKIVTQFLHLNQESHLTILHNAAYKGLQLLLSKSPIKK